VHGSLGGKHPPGKLAQGARKKKSDFENHELQQGRGLKALSLPTSFWSCVMISNRQPIEDLSIVWRRVVGSIIAKQSCDLRGEHDLQ
jgi:hypothetical protein